VHDIETSTDKRDRTLKHLLKLNHANFSILYNRLRFHNHTPHVRYFFFLPCRGGAVPSPPRLPSCSPSSLVVCDFFQLEATATRGTYFKFSFYNLKLMRT
jgi:hypothetical protein